MSQRLYTQQMNEKNPPQTFLTKFQLRFLGTDKRKTKERKTKEMKKNGKKEPQKNKQSSKQLNRNKQTNKQTNERTNEQTNTITANIPSVACNPCCQLRLPPHKGQEKDGVHDTPSACFFAGCAGPRWRVFPKLQLVVWSDIHLNYSRSLIS